MNFQIVNLFFPLVMALHNAEEYSRYDDFTRIYHAWLPRKYTTRSVTLSGLTLLTLTVAVVSISASVTGNTILTSLSKIAIFGLALNAVMHCAMSLKRKAILPGTITAALVVLPYSAFAIASMGMTRASLLQLIPYLVFGALAVPVAFVVFVALGYLVSCCTAYVRRCYTR